MAVSQTEHPPPSSELESIPPSWPLPTEQRSPWRMLLVPSAASGCFHVGIVCVLVLIQFEFMPNEPAAAYTEQLHQRYLIDNSDDWRQFQNLVTKASQPVLGPNVFDFDGPTIPDAEEANERTLATQAGESPTVRPRMPDLSQPRGAEAMSVPPEYYTTFKQHILPIFQVKCGDCHSGAKAKGGLDLTSVATILKPNDMGTILVPGNTQKSLLHDAVADGYMPPQGSEKHKLTAAEKLLIVNWIETGQPGDAAAAQAGQAAPQTDGSSAKSAEPAPKALEMEEKYQGKVTAETEGVSVTVSGAQGAMTFQYEEETNVVSAGDPRFFPYKGALVNQNVTVIYHQKNGANFARLISVGGRDFSK
jgi:hypothetical protein